jgi:hypothetical protein
MPRVANLWRKWCQSAPIDGATTVPATLSTPPVPIGRMLAQSVANPSLPIHLTGGDDRWVKKYAELPIDTQLLSWLHLLIAPDNGRNDVDNDDSLDARLRWNHVVVIQNSPLPFVLRAQMTLSIYDFSITMPQLPMLPDVTVATFVRPITAWDNVAKNHGISLDQTLWETYHFSSTPPYVKEALKSFLKDRKPTKSEEVYKLLRHLDKSNVNKTFANAMAIVCKMVHVTQVVALVYQQTNKVDIRPSMEKLTLEIVAPLIDKLSKQPSVVIELVNLAHLLHLHSLMSFAQLRRATLQFWPLVSSLL